MKGESLFGRAKPEVRGKVPTKKGQMGTARPDHRYIGDGRLKIQLTTQSSISIILFLSFFLRPFFCCFLDATTQNEEKQPNE